MTKAVYRTIIRIVLVSLYAILVMRLVSLAMPHADVFLSITYKILFLFIYLCCFNLNVEGNLYFDRYLNKKLSWFYVPKKRLLIQLSFLFIWSFITIGLPFALWYYANEHRVTNPIKPVFIYISSVVFLMGFIGFTLVTNFFKQWKASLLETEYYKQEKLKADYRVLQNQVNPHFLFNSLNVLISEIKHDPNTAVEFTRKLSKVYRYVLQSKNYDLISLKAELQFIQSFVFLHKVRIGEALQLEVNVSEELLTLQLPPLTLQILVENVIKHNVINEENRMTITIKNDGDATLIVSNTLHIIENVDSTYTGLSNLKKRFELLKKDGFTYGEKEDQFIVTLPLIED